MTGTLTLKENPDWYAAAQALINSCATLKSIDERVRLMEKVCLDMGENIYPAFLQILCYVEKYGDDSAQHLVTDTLVNALTTGRLPSGKLSAWGATTVNSSSAFGQTRSLGPIEYLCAWYSQPSGRQPLPANSFQQVMLSLLGLISSNEPAKQLYCEKLIAEVQDPINGTLSSQTKIAMEKLAQEWASGNTLENIVDAYFNALQGDRLDRLSNIDSLLRR